MLSFYSNNPTAAHLPSEENSIIFNLLRDKNACFCICAFGEYALAGQQPCVQLQNGIDRKLNLRV
jgi:hypothetical protein